jgi:RNA polymerase sigma-70 factor (ECF subfamily)
MVNRAAPARLSIEGLDARFRRPLMSYFKRRVGDHAEAEDLTQQVFMRLLAADDFERVEQVEGYVFTVAANLLKDRGRRASRRGERSAERIVIGPNPDLVEELTREAVEDRSPERVLMGRETLADVLRTLDALGERTRDIYILFRLENMKQREIAILLGIGQSTVEKHVVKATLHLARTYGST